MITDKIENIENIEDNENYKRLKRVIKEQLEISMDRIKLNSRFELDLGADSLDVVEIVIAIEYEFGLEIDDAMASEIVSVRDALRYIER